MKINNVTDLGGKVIESTYDYSMFKDLLGNRIIRDNHVTEIRNSMAKNHLANIVIINEFGMIIDGQHSVYAAAELGLPVNYIVMKGYGVEEVAILNTNTSNWKEIDFIQQKSDLYDAGAHEFEAYRKVIDIVETESFNYKTALYVLEGGKIAGNKEIVSGELRIPKGNDGIVSERIDLLNQCIGTIGSKAKTSSFAQATVLTMQVPGFIKKTFLMKMKTGKNVILNAKSGREDLLFAIESVYNKNLKASSILAIKIQADIIYKQIKRKA